MIKDIGKFIWVCCLFALAIVWYLLCETYYFVIDIALDPLRYERKLIKSHEDRMAISTYVDNCVQMGVKPW